MRLLGLKFETCNMGFIQEYRGRIRLALFRNRVFWL